MASAAVPIIGSVAGGLISKQGAEAQADAQLEAAEQARDIPDWLKPFYIGDPGPVPQPQPINYNWLDAMNTIATSGMPGTVHPFSMNNPMMTFENVYTPTAGGPWGYGLGPGQLTTEVGIPGGPGPQFVQPGDNFAPGPTTPQPATPDPGAGNVIDPDMLALARWYEEGINNRNRLAADWGEQVDYNPVGSLAALEWANKNPQAMGAMQSGADPVGYGFYRGTDRDIWGTM